MTQLRVVPIVEGHGEVIAVRLLLERIWTEVVHAEYIDVLQPVRRPRTKLLRRNPDDQITRPDDDEVTRAVSLAVDKLELAQAAPMQGLILLLLDADTDCPKDLVPQLVNLVQEAAGANDITVVLAKVEYETWFVAAAESLADFLQLPDDGLPTDPEAQGCGKGWIEERFLKPKYSETIDQVKLTARMDLQVCRERSPSFDKLCRELESRARSAKSI